MCQIVDLKSHRRATLHAQIAAALHRLAQSRFTKPEHVHATLAAQQSAQDAIYFARFELRRLIARPN